MKRFLPGLIAVLLCLAVTACGTDSSTTQDKKTESATPAAKQENAPQAAPAPQDAAPAPQDAAPAPQDAAPAPAADQENSAQAATEATAAPKDTLQPTSGNAVENSLLHHHFTLLTADGVDFSSKKKIPDLEFGDNMRAYGGICNRYSGKAEIEGDMLYIRQMASTRMLCVDEELNRLEGEFGKMMDKGVKMEFDGKTLTLTGDGHTLVFAFDGIREERQQKAPQ